MWNSIEEVNRKFDWTIKKSKGEIKQIAIIDKKLFNLTHNFSLLDWKEIRDDNYWNTIDSLNTLLNKKKFILNRVNKYLQEKNLNDLITQEFIKEEKRHYKE